MEQSTAQTPNLLGQLLGNTYTKNSALRRLRLLTDIINYLLFKDAGRNNLSAVFSAVRAERAVETNQPRFEADMVFFESLPEQFYRLFTPTSAPEILDSIEKQIENSKIVLIYVPFDAPDNEVARIGIWFKQNVGLTALFDLVFDPTLVAGCALSLNGIYKDYSMKEKLKQNRSLILDELNQLKKR